MSKPSESRKPRTGFWTERTGVYRDALRYAHFMVEADLELYRTTKEEYLLNRAKKNVDAFYERWKAKPPDDMISNAAIAPRAVVDGRNGDGRRTGVLAGADQVVKVAVPAK